MSNVRIIRDQDGCIVTIEVIAGPGVHTGPGGESICERHAGGWLIKFPHAAFSDDDQEAKCAVLADQNSIWAFVFMHTAVGTLFADLVNDVEKDIKEVVNYVPDSVQRLVEHRGRFGFARVDREDLLYPDYNHNGDLKGVYCITLKDGTRIALDIAGAQYNLHHTPIMHWQAYLSRWARSIEYRVPFRSHNSKHLGKMSGYRCITQQTIIMEQMAYFNVFLTDKLGLELELQDLVDMDSEDFQYSKGQLIRHVTDYLCKRCTDLDSNVDTDCLTGTFDLRRPKVIAKLPIFYNPLIQSERPESMPLDIGEMSRFGWVKLRKLIQMPSTEVKYHEKKKAKLLLGHRCVYKMPGDWKLVFLTDTLPSLKVPFECVSENPYWNGN
ncbi:hypothetical protein BKA66DRAFT_449959 [Pyrenochaeta sp. MPI-SDFR-AT-0127]|nr:hypothetical protein BKA66DRAFT_449959 [Pyrenochaeta sp. MPI-SDFR-AT-0127]